MSFWMSWNFQSFFSDISSFLESFHDLVMVWLFIIIIIVSFVSFFILISPFSTISLDSEMLEQFWTVLPIIILMSIAFPSVYLLCLQDSFFCFPSSSIKISANQWNWQSEFNENIDHLLDMDGISDIVSYENPSLFKHGLLLRLIIISTDVLHSLGVPSLGIKLDAMPGRLNATMIEAMTPGLMVGACFELCGSGHSAMPISFMVD